ncbi:hypothetical protein MMC25_002808 [Agyrium rufum]|nr:hypothetical protein [Agyrium rufum]
MSQFTVFPPHKIHTSHPISATDALILVSAYLSASTTEAYLHPNARFGDDGNIETGIAGSASGGLVLHNLRRVEAGLRGEHLAADLEFAAFGRNGDGVLGEMLQGRVERDGDGDGAAVKKRKMKVGAEERIEQEELDRMGPGAVRADERRGGGGEGKEDGDGDGDVEMGQEGWQDKEEYEREQEIEEGEIGARNNALDATDISGGGEQGVNGEVEGEIPQVTIPKSRRTLEKRKADKKMRKKDEKKRREKVRRGSD